MWTIQFGIKCYKLNHQRYKIPIPVTLYHTKKEIIFKDAHSENTFLEEAHQFIFKRMIYRPRPETDLCALCLKALTRDWSSTERSTVQGVLGPSERYPTDWGTLSPLRASTCIFTKYLNKKFNLINFHAVE